MPRILFANIIYFSEKNIHAHEIKTLVPCFDIVFENIKDYYNFAIGRSRDITDTTKNIKEFYPIFYKYGESIIPGID